MHAKAKETESKLLDKIQQLKESHINEVQNLKSEIESIKEHQLIKDQQTQKE